MLLITQTSHLVLTVQLQLHRIFFGLNEIILDCTVAIID